jgi:hypothetical protein
MKIEMRTSASEPSCNSGGGGASATCETRPSAGETINPSPTGVTRSGSRKK